jgi:pimeloyl-ACP methyl ester carboxylesterase
MKKIILGLVIGIPLVFAVLIVVYPVQMGQWVYDSSMSAEASIYGFSEQTIPIGEMSLSVYRNSDNLGADKPSILMLHGYSAEKTVWLRFARHFTDDFNIVIPDMAGHGHTGFDLDWDYTGPAQATRLVALLDRLQIQKVHVIGNSMGGFIAAHFARLYPERTSTATLVDPAGVTSPELSVMGEMLEKGENPFQVNSREDFEVFYDMTMAKPPFVPDFVKVGVAERYQARQDELKTIFEDFHGKDLLDEYLSTINKPVLIMWGAKDQLIHVSSAKIWNDGLPNSELKIWPEIGHMPMVEIPQESADVYREFLSKH